VKLFFILSYCDLRFESLSNTLETMF
jgi:hypothetical protein